MEGTNNTKKIFKEEDVDIRVKRELLNVTTQSGEAMYNYVVKENVVAKVLENGKLVDKKREIAAEFAVKKKDFGGYEMLDIIFMLADDAHLTISNDTMTDEVTGKKTSFKVYEIWNEDDEGIRYSYRVKPIRESDKSKLDIIIQKRLHKLNAEASAQTKKE